MSPVEKTNMLLRHLVTLQMTALHLMLADSKASDEVKMVVVQAIESTSTTIKTLIDFEIEE